MTGGEVWRDVADQLEREAARLEEECALAGVAMPDPECSPSIFGSFDRGQFRDAGLARSLREAAAELRDAGALLDPTERLLSTSVLRIRSWLLARQVEYDGQAELAMVTLTHCRDQRERTRAVARSAYAIGRARGVRLAADMWNAMTQAESGASRAR